MLLAAAGLVYADWRRAAPPEAAARATFVGRGACVECHRTEHDEWLGSHHDLAMDLATDETVLADFNDATFERLGVTTRFFRDGQRFMVDTEGPDGERRDYEVKYTFGVDPLQQYMVPMEDGRVQVLRVSWNTNKNEWFYVSPPDVVDERILPDDPMHWTGVSQNWNATCAECHSTNLQKNFDLASNTYYTTFSEIDVSCEECHGPGSLHVELANRASLFWDRRHGYGLAKLKGMDGAPQIETCAKCHSRRTAVHPDFRPGQPLTDFYEPSLLHEGLYHAGGQIQDEVYVYGSFLQSEMHRKGVRCTDCHNPHSLKLKFEGSALCAQCHEPGKYDVPAHHHHEVGTAGASCVECHMPETTYMHVDPRRDHSLRVPRPDLTVSTGAPNACNKCHTKPQEDAAWAADAVEEWFGPQRYDDPHWAPAIVAGRRGAPEGESLLVDACRRETTPGIVRATAIELLSQYDGEEARAAVRKGLQSFDPLERLAAVHAAAPRTPGELVDLLGERLEDPSRVVRAEAARRLVAAPPELLGQELWEARSAALAEYRERQRMQSDRAAGHLNLANLAIQQGDAPEAIKEFRAAIRLEPYLAGARAGLADLLNRLERQPEEVERLRREEIELLERNVELVPDDPLQWYELGRLRVTLGQYAEALPAFERACELAPESYDFRLMLALAHERAYQTTGDQEHFDAAVDSLRKLDAMDPSNPNARNILRRLLQLRREQGS